MTKEQRVEYIIQTALLVKMVVDKIDLLKDNGVTFRHQLKFHANGFEKEFVKLGEWFWDSLNGEDGEKEIHKLEDKINSISKSISTILPRNYDKLDNVIKSFKNAIN